MRIAALVLAVSACTSASAFALSPEELAEIVNTKGQAGLAEIWGLLVVKDSPHCESESLVAKLDFGDSDRESAQVAVLEISGDSRREVLFLGKNGTNWRCLGHEGADDRSPQPVRVLKSWGTGLLCALELHGSGTGCCGDLEEWFLVQPERSSKVCSFGSCGTELIEGLGVGASDEDYEMSVDECGDDLDKVSYQLDLKWSLGFENKDGAIRYEDVLKVDASGSLTVNKRTGEVVLKSAALGDSWKGVEKLEGGDPRLVCALAPRRVAELAKSAPESCGAFMRRCASECEDPCLAAELKDILRERGMDVPASDSAPNEVQSHRPDAK